MTPPNPLHPLHPHGLTRGDRSPTTANPPKLMATKTKANKWSTEVNWDFDGAPLITDYKEMGVQQFCGVGASKFTLIACYYAKARTAISDEHPEGVFFEIGGDERFWDAKEVFASGNLLVYAMWPKKLTLIGDDREPID